MTEISPDVLTFLLAVLVPFVVQAIRLAIKYTAGNVTGSRIKWAVYAVSIGLAGWFYYSSGGGLPPLPVFQGEPSVVVGSVLNFVGAFSGVLIVVFKTSTFLYDRLLKSVFEKLGLA